MKRKYVGYGFICICLIVIVSLNIAASDSGQLDLMQQIGAVEKPLSDAELGEVAYQGKTITVYKGELKQVTDRFLLTGKSEQDALEFLLNKKAMYQKAIASGYSVTDKEVYEQIEKDKEILKSVTVNRDEMEAYFKGMGMSIDEYCDAQFDAIKEELAILKYKNQTCKEKASPK